MPPRKRKAAPRLQPICEAEVSPQQDVQECRQSENEPHAADQQPLQHTAAVEAINKEVQRRVNCILTEGREAAEALRQELQIATLKIPKKVREMTVAEFFQLTPEEARSTRLTGLLERLKAMAGDAWQPSQAGGDAPQRPAGTCTATEEAGAGGPSVSQGPVTAAPATRTTRRTASRTAAATGIASDAPAATMTAARARRTRAVTVQVQEEQQLQQDQQQPAASSLHAAAAAAPGALLPPAGPGTALRRQPLASRMLQQQQTAQESMQQHQQQIPLQQQQQHGHGPPRKPVAGEVAFSANGSPLAVLPHSVPSSVMGTPAGNGGGLPLTTPGGAQLAALAQGAQVAPSAAALLMTGGVGPTAVKGAVIPGIPGARGGAAALPGAGGTALAGFTLVKTNAVKGRTRGARTRAGNDENAIMITTQDGRQFQVDGATGLACVPDAYRQEVGAQLELMQQLLTAALHRG